MDTERVNGYTITRYTSRDSGFCISWPTGFSGAGYVVRDASGAVVSRHAFRYDALVAAA